MSSLIHILIYIFIVILSQFIPIGNENSTVRRLPWVTFVLIGLNVLIYYGTLPKVAEDQKAMMEAAVKLERFITEHPETLVDEEARQKMVDMGLINKSQEEQLDKEMQMYQDMGLMPSKGKLVGKVKEEFDQILDGVQQAREDSLWFKFGFAPNGQWKLHQLITSAFIHGSFEHLFGNMLFFFAVAFTLEDLWGRGTFLGFYLLGAAASCIPSIVSPEPLVGIGASGAIFAVVGAFLIRLPRTKIKLFVMTAWFARLLMGAKKFTVLIPAYIYLTAFFVEQLILFYYVKKAGGIQTVGYTVHIAGFIFGAGFAAIMKASKVEETHINPKLEAKISFSAPVEVTDAIEALDKGDTANAERKLRQHLARHPNSLETILALIQVYQRTLNYDQLNAMYGRLIHYHLSKQDKEAALFAYDNLLQAFPEDNLSVKIPTRDWIVLCEYLSEAEMYKESAVEYERMIKAWPDDPLSPRAAFQAAEAAFTGQDVQRAFNLYEQAKSMRPAPALASRIEIGLEKCRRIIENRPKWEKAPPKAPTIYRGF